MVVGGGGGGSSRKCSRELNIAKTVSTTVQLSTKLYMEHFSIRLYLYSSTRNTETTQFWSQYKLLVWSDSQHF